MASEFLTTEERAALAPLQITKRDGLPDLLCGDGMDYAHGYSGSGSIQLDGEFNAAQLRAIAAFIQPAAV